MAIQAASNSLSEIIKNLTSFQRNYLEIVQRLTDAITTNTDTVNIDLTDENGNITRVNIPSFGFLKREIERVDTNVQALSGLNESEANIRLPDGTFQRIITNSLQREANNVTTLRTPEQFNIKNNFFFESFLNPLLFVTYDLTGQLPVDTRNILINRFILNLDTPEKVSYFNANYNGRADIDYNAFLDDLDGNGIDFFLDEDTINMPLRQNQFYGTFNVLRISDEEVTRAVDEVTFTTRVKQYKLNKLTYSDRRSRFMDTVELKVGDNLLVNDDTAETKYEVTEIDTATNTVTLRVIQGFDSINIGVDQLRIFPTLPNFLQAQIAIGFNERQVIFIKGIDVNSNIPSDDFSPGTAFYTNELTFTDEQGVTADLATYYNNEVIDFGSFLLASAKEANTPGILGIQPDAPALSADDFTVSEINQHLTRKKAVEDLKRLQTQKNTVRGEIEELDLAIAQQRDLLATKRFKSEIERQTDQARLDQLRTEQNSKNRLLSSINQQILDAAQNETIGTDPKYRVRGFWPIPAAKNGQEVIQFRVNYRYINTEGDGNPTEQIQFTEDGETRRGSFSTWIEYKTDVRQKEIDDDGNASFIVNDVEDGDVNNINQLDIPIQQGEQVEIRIRSISEAGFPVNPLESEFSEVITVSFPEDLAIEDSTASILEQGRAEDVNIRLREELTSQGIDQHLSGQFTANEKFFAHQATDIASGFLTPEQTPINLFDKLTEIDNELAALRELIEQARGSLRVRVIDEDGNETVISNNTENQIFAGFYSELVRDLSVKKGVIITRTFFLSIDNTAASDLELTSIAAGDTKAVVSDTNYKLGNDFTTNRRYDEVPLIIRDSSSNFYDDATVDVFREFEQTQQVGSQFVYLRYKNLRSSDDLYVTGASPIAGGIEATIADTNSSINIGTNNFLWDQTSNPAAPGFKSVVNDLDVHIDHPNISGIFGDNSLVRMPIVNTVDETSDKKQVAYFTESGISVKTAFEPNDQFLVGPRSVGSFLSLSVGDHSELITNGSSILDTKTVRFGDENSLKIPIIFQFRMTDYFGEGNTGIGNIAGDATGSTTNVAYSKRLGFDIIDRDNNLFAFDLEFQARYRSEGATVANIPSRSFDNAISDLSNVVQTLRPNLTQ